MERDQAGMVLFGDVIPELYQSADFASRIGTMSSALLSRQRAGRP
jgi:hypothetical protein